MVRLSAALIRHKTHSPTNLFPPLNLTNPWNFLPALAVWSSRRRQELVRFEDSSLIDSRLDHYKERTNFALEKVNVGGRNLGQSIDRRSPKTDRRLYGRESYQKARDAEPGFDVHSLRGSRIRERTTE